MKAPKPTPYRDPVTGDLLTVGEKFSWIMQSIIRRWLFIGIITVATIVVWSANKAIGLTWWNLGASYLALLIESTVGIAMFSQTRRDAVAIRETRALAKEMVAADEKRDRILAHLEGADQARAAADEKRDRILAHLEEAATARAAADVKREQILAKLEQARRDRAQVKRTLREIEHEEEQRS
jgi:hypothetical protein